MKNAEASRKLASFKGPMENTGMRRCACKEGRQIGMGDISRQKTECCCFVLLGSVFVSFVFRIPSSENVQITNQNGVRAS